MMQGNSASARLLRDDVGGVLAGIVHGQAQSSGSSAAEPAFSAGFGFVEKSGEQLFASVCQGCHMSDGKGAAGAGTYPSLAGDGNLEAADIRSHRRQRAARNAAIRIDDERRSGRRRRELSADAFRQPLPGYGDGRRCKSRSWIENSAPRDRDFDRWHPNQGIRADRTKPLAVGCRAAAHGADQMSKGRALGRSPKAPGSD